MIAGQESAEPAAETPEAEATELEAGEETESDSANSGDRTRLNLLGEVSSESGEAQRNENVRLTLIDNNVLKELLRRMGATATLTSEFNASRTYFGLEYGGNPAPSLHVPSAAANRIHGELSWSHQNSATSARSFFQAGGVRPARTNDFSFKLGVPLGKGTALTTQLSQRRLLGQVNGNVLVPAADERIPTTRDPARIELINRVIGAYPNELPNRTDINERALNTNAPQNIRNDRASGTLDNVRGDNRLTLRYNVTLQNVEAFQLVGGQNPDTTTRNHAARVTWNRSWTPTTTVDLTASFERVGSLLVPEETSLGPFFLFSRILQSIGPGGNIPIDRTRNVFRYGARIQRTSGNHTITAGAEVSRRQVNGSESNNHRGTFSFRADFGRSALGNLLEGTPSTFRFAIGSSHRGFRNTSWVTYLQDSWKVDPRLTLQFGLRFEPVGSPYEIHGLSEVPYDRDWNNFAPTVGFSFSPQSRIGVFRGAYGLHYGQLFDATYMQTRFNTPSVLSVIVNAPDLIDPLRGFTAGQLDTNARSTRFALEPELSTPYSHQYNFSWTMEPSREWNMSLGYVGSRSHRLLNQRYTNRGHPTPGIPQTTRTVNQRRPDPRFFDILQIVNGSIGYYDAAKVTLRVPNLAGLNLETSYWLSKAIDLAADYTNTATGRDGRLARSPAEYDVWNYMKGPSGFDQPHAFLWRINYAFPTDGKRMPSLLRGWQLTSVVLWKSGTPFSVRSGSDSPGIGNVDGAGSDRPNLEDPSILGMAVNHPDRSREILSRDRFSFIQPTDPAGDLGRNTFRKDSVWNVNLALSRRMGLPGDASALFRAESLNILNHPQFAEPDINVASRTFGAITNTLNDGRTFRFTLQVTF